jgi:hypothetical protein
VFVIYNFFQNISDTRTEARLDKKFILVSRKVSFILQIMKLESSWQIFEKYSNINFNENPSHLSMWTVLIKLTVAFRNFANASNKGSTSLTFQPFWAYIILIYSILCSTNTRLIQGDQKVCVLDDYNTIVRCTGTFWSPCTSTLQPAWFRTRQISLNEITPLIHCV